MKVFLYLLTLVGFTVAQICPPPEVLYPCTCDEQFKDISCRRIKRTESLKDIFNNASAYLDDDVIFDNLSITDTALIEIKEGDIEHLKFKEIGIYNNRDLTYISPRAFNASMNITVRLGLFMNRIRNDPPHERDIFDFVKGFPNVESVLLLRNEISSIPDNAFQNLPSLGRISLAINRITHIGSKAFATGGTNLLEVSLDDNFIPSEGLPEDAFSGLGGYIPSFYLDKNPMEFLDERSFKPLLDNAGSVIVGGETCDVDEKHCSLQRFYCDERAHWICDNMERLRLRLKGFLCRPGAGADNIQEYCDNLRNNAKQ